jgi:hypothetical protein
LTVQQNIIFVRLAEQNTSDRYCNSASFCIEKLKVIFLPSLSIFGLYFLAVNFPLVRRLLREQGAEAFVFLLRGEILRVETLR